MSKAVQQRHHKYHAEAHVLNGTFHLPLSREIPEQAYVSLPAHGGYLAQNSGEFSVENVLSFRSAYTQVGGNRDVKKGHGWSTLVTSVIEGLNILEVVTADRIVAQIGTEFPLEGYVPSVTFLATRYENLRICGNPVSVELDLDLIGPKPENDVHYNADPGFIARVCAHHERMRRCSGVPQEIAARYNRLPTAEENRESIECSLVKNISGEIPGCFYGNVIDVPNFGKVELANVSLKQSMADPKAGLPPSTTIELTMLQLNMGCVIAGKSAVGSGKTNGQSYP